MSIYKSKFNHAIRPPEYHNCLISHIFFDWNLLDTGLYSQCNAWSYEKMKKKI